MARSNNLVIYALGFSLILNVAFLMERWMQMGVMRTSVINAAIPDEKYIRISCENAREKKDKHTETASTLAEPSGPRSLETQEKKTEEASAEAAKKPAAEPEAPPAEPERTTQESPQPVQSKQQPTANEAAEPSAAGAGAGAGAGEDEEEDDEDEDEEDEEELNDNAPQEEEEIEYSEIPKKLHFVYLSPGFPDDQAPIPEHYAYNMKGWESLHPDYTVTLWNNTMMKKEFPQIPELLSTVTAMAWVSDVLRYHVIQKYGGIYMDMDIAPVQSLEFLRSNYGPAFTDCEDHGTRNQPKPVKSVSKYLVPHIRYGSGGGHKRPQYCRNINNNVIASVAQHPVMDCIVKGAIAASVRDLDKDPKRNPKYRLARTGPKRWQQCAFKHEDVNIFHSSLFHPCGFFQRNGCNVDDYKGQGHVYGMHEWKGSWKNGGKGMGTTKAEAITSGGGTDQAVSSTQRKNLR